MMMFNKHTRVTRMMMDVLDQQKKNLQKKWPFGLLLEWIIYSNWNDFLYFSNENHHHFFIIRFVMINRLIHCVFVCFFLPCLFKLEEKPLKIYPGNFLSFPKSFPFHNWWKKRKKTTTDQTEFREKRNGWMNFFSHCWI